MPSQFRNIYNYKKKIIVQNQAPHYLVGIDLGTTHTVVAYAKNTQQDIHLLQIEQLIAPGQVNARPLLPSVRYHPAPGELSSADIVFSPPGETAVIGEAARLLGAKTKGRFVTSAKSWLSHPSVDHSADILPWGSSDDIDKVSPIDASASYLAHIRTVWGHKFPDAPLEQQDVVITVPASFDEGAAFTDTGSGADCRLTVGAPVGGTAGGLLRLAEASCRKL